jgi:hypothetical protein
MMAGRSRGGNECLLTALGERRQHTPRHPIAPRPFHMLIDREQLDNVVARLQHGPEALVVGKVDEIEPMRRLD